jgi:hypothetical protein
MLTVSALTVPDSVPVAESASPAGSAPAITRQR